MHDLVAIEVGRVFRLPQDTVGHWHVAVVSVVVVVAVQTADVPLSILFATALTLLTSRICTAIAIIVLVEVWQ